MANAATTGGRFDIGRVITHTFGAVRHNAVTFSILALVLAGAPALISSVGLISLVHRALAMRAAGAPDFAGLASGLQLTGLGGLIGFITSAILQGAIIYGTASYLNGRTDSLGDCFSAGLRSCLPLIGLMLLTFLALMVGFVLLIVPAIMMSIAWFVAAPALVVERTGVFGAFGRSADLTRGRRWPLLGLALIYVIAGGVVRQALVSLVGTAVVSVTPQAMVLHQLPVNAAFGVVLSVISAAGTAAVYYELRSTREGIGPEALAAVFD